MLPDNNGEIGAPCGSHHRQVCDSWVVRRRCSSSRRSLPLGLQPDLEQPRRAAVADPSGHRVLHQLDMGGYCRNNRTSPRPPPGVPLPDEPFHLANGVEGRTTQAADVLFWLQVGLEDRLRRPDAAAICTTPILQSCGESPAASTCHPVWDVARVRTGRGTSTSRFWLLPPDRPNSAIGTPARSPRSSGRSTSVAPPLERHAVGETRDVRGGRSAMSITAGKR